MTPAQSCNRHKISKRRLRGLGRILMSMIRRTLETGTETCRALSPQALRVFKRHRQLPHQQTAHRQALIHAPRLSGMGMTSCGVSRIRLSEMFLVRKRGWSKRLRYLICKIRLLQSLSHTPCRELFFHRNKLMSLALKPFPGRRCLKYPASWPKTTSTRIRLSIS